jgi:hypothetical protein
MPLTLQCVAQVIQLLLLLFVVCCTGGGCVHLKLQPLLLVRQRLNLALQLLLVGVQLLLLGRCCCALLVQLEAQV